MRSLWPAATEVAELPDALAPYLDVDRTPAPGRCWVLSNMVSGLDGTAAVRGKVGALSGTRDVELFLAMRAVADVVLVGAETVRRERYGPVRLNDDLARRRRRSGRTAPRIAVVSSSLHLDPRLPLFADADPARPPFVITSSQAVERHPITAPHELVVAGDERVDLSVALDELAARSSKVVLCEGGPTLLGQLIADDLLDEFCLTLSPVVGGDPLPVVDTRSMSDLKRFRLAHVLEEDHTMFLRYLASHHDGR